MDRRDRYLGALLGLATGDALGTALEFAPPGSFEPVTDITGGGPFRLPPGHWTDDTSLALCLAESLVTRRGFDPADQMARYLRWYREGHLSSTGQCFDIGGTTCQALTRFEATGEPYSGPTDARSAGNGSLMRLAPIPLAFAHDPATAIHLAGQGSRTTHGAQEAIDACRYYAGLIVGALAGLSKESLLAPSYSPVPGLWAEEPLAPGVAEVAGETFLVKEPPAIRGTGYVVQSLEAALWAFHRADDFRQGALLAVNLGDDADTTGAIYGQLAGAYYGVDGIPREWRERLVGRDLISGLAGGLYLLHQGLASGGCVAAGSPQGQ